MRQAKTLGAPLFLITLFTFKSFTMSCKNTILKLDGWYTGQFRTDSEGVQYAVMHYIGPGERDEYGNLIVPDDDFAHYRRKGENVGDTVVYYHGFNSLINNKTV